MNITLLELVENTITSMSIVATYPIPQFSSRTMGTTYKSLVFMAFLLMETIEVENLLDNFQRHVGTRAHICI